jgi:arylsulfatase A-like enzyme
MRARRTSRPGLIAVSLLAILAATARGQAERPARPNVLFVAIDDLNDWTGFLGGQPGARTPNLDKLAARGQVFTRAYCNAPACNPSRASLLCGVRPSTSGVYHNDQPWRPVLRDAVTLPQHFTAAGYDVRGGGKIFHNSYNDLPSWQEWHREKGNPAPAEKPVNGIPRAAHFDWGPVAAADADMGDFKTVSWASEYLSQSHEKPFFLAVGLIKPHLPWYVPQSYFDLFPLDGVTLPPVRAGDLDDVPAAGVRIANPNGDHARVLAANQWRPAVRGYLASIAFADAQVGRLIEALDRSPHAANTIVVLWGDHGWHLGEKEHWRKFALWEEATRVPLIVLAPGRTKAGARCVRTVSLLDLYPTLVDLCGLPAKPGLEGRSLAPLLADPNAPWAHPAVTTHGRENHAVRDERWRYIRYADGSEELYDHDADPQEWTNLAGSSDPAAVAAKRALARSLPERNAPDAPRARNAKQGDRDAE